jgi:transcription initiation factor IIE alpha subunit
MNATSKTPSCSKSNTEVHLTLSERSNGSFHCGDCGERFPVTKNNDKTIVPKHNISEELHALRKRLDREEREGRSRGSVGNEHLTGEANLTTTP